MRKPFGLPGQTSLQVLCACSALWGMPAAALSAPEKITPTTPAVSTHAPATQSSPANNTTARIGSVSFDRRALTLVVMACLVGVIAGWTSGGPREPRVRLLNKPKKKTELSVLVPPGPAPRLIPSDSPKATRPRPAGASVSRQTPAGTTRSGIVDYIAAFADSGAANEEGRVDYLLEPDDSVEESVDPPRSR